MIASDVLIVGGGPAGSSCARRLVQAGLAVTVIDQAVFPRDKVCAGWITPQVVEELALDVDDYRRGRTFQPILGFRVGIIGRGRPIDVAYDRPVSFGIRRCEFDHYLLARAGARLATGEPVHDIRRRDHHWIVNGRFTAPVLVGAGGHFCPVARRMNRIAASGPLVAAQEVEFAVEGAGGSQRGYRTPPACPELYFSADFRGYGWAFRKASVINLGFGSLDRHGLPGAVAGFVRFLEQQDRIPADGRFAWRGHAYRLYEAAPRRVVDDGVMLIGDAAGLAYPESGEGIRPAVESGMMAAQALTEARGAAALDAYEALLRARFGAIGRSTSRRSAVPSRAVAGVGRELFRLPWFVRRVVLDRWFLHAGDEAIAG